jgi:hypothetical protein
MHLRIARSPRTHSKLLPEPARDVCVTTKKIAESVREESINGSTLHQHGAILCRIKPHKIETYLRPSALASHAVTRFSQSVTSVEEHLAHIEAAVIDSVLIQEFSAAAETDEESVVVSEEMPSENPIDRRTFYKIHAQMSAPSFLINAPASTEKRHAHNSFPWGILDLHVSSSRQIGCSRRSNKFRVKRSKIRLA